MKKWTLIIICWCAIGYSQKTNYPLNSGGDFSSEAYSKVKLYPQSSGFSKSFPASYSLKKYCPSPPDQGYTATCTGWSVAYASHTILYAIKNKLTDTEKINKAAFDPYFLYNTLKEKSDNGCMLGVVLDDAIEFLQTTGSIKRSEFMLDCTTQPTEDMTLKAKEVRIKNFYRLFEYGDTTFSKVIGSIKSALTNNHPVVCNILVGFIPKDAGEQNTYRPSFFDVKDLWEPTEKELDQKLSTYSYPHNVTIIGYDDEKFGGCLELMNSYGTSWGNAGFFYISYRDFITIANGAFSVE